MPNVWGHNYERPTLKYIIDDTVKARCAPTVKPKLVSYGVAKFTTTDGEVVWRYRRTDVVTFNPRFQHYYLRSGGWKTPTTKGKINEFSPARVCSVDGLWYVGDKVPFYEGIAVDIHGQPVDPPRAAIAKRVKRDLAAIKKFCNKLDKMKTLPMPNNGDCYLCRFCDNTNKPMGDLEHVKEHVKEGYLHGSLLVNAMRWCNLGDASIALLLNGIVFSRGRVKHYLYRYLKHCYGMAM